MIILAEYQLFDVFVFVCGVRSKFLCIVLLSAILIQLYKGWFTPSNFRSQVLLKFKKMNGANHHFYELKEC